MKLVSKVVKMPDKPAEIQNKAELLAKLDKLPPGLYQLVIEPFPEKLESLKKYYFSMESELARYLGYKKTELHEIMKVKIGQKIDINTGKTVYESIAEIKNVEEMQQRIIEYQIFAAETHKYIFKDKQI
jgi:hypothetical protein